MILAALALCIFPSVPPTLQDLAAAAAVARGHVEALQARDRIPGGSVAVTIGDEIVWEHSFGVANLDDDGPVGLGTRFRVGSLTKLLTVAALLRLVDQQRLELDEPVSKRLPDFPHGDITLRQLAGHLSGIRHYTEAEFLNTTAYASATDSLRKFASDALVAPPGERYLYSSYGYDVLGAVIERVTEKRFDEAVRELVTAPLGLSATSFASDAATATFYDNSKDGPVASPATDLSDRYPAGAALSTAHDLALFLGAMSGERFLSAAARTEMALTQHTADEKPTNVGLAWRLATDGAGRTFLHHGGAVTGGRAFALFYPAERVSVAIVTNLGFASFNEKDALSIAAPFLEARAPGTAKAR